jgi:hypothetical protein
VNNSKLELRVEIMTNYNYYVINDGFH